jgi:hypothetical protein
VFVLDDALELHRALEYIERSIFVAAGLEQIGELGVRLTGKA